MLGIGLEIYKNNAFIIILKPSPSSPVSFLDLHRISAMDSGEFPAGRSPRKELQGPRPTPLRINKDSHKISKKPPVPPWMQAQIRPPLIIYAVSPKVIHTNPSDFMNLVQRLTGMESSSATTLTFGASLSGAFPVAGIHNSGAISPAASYATIAGENPDGKQNNQTISSRVEREVSFVDEMETGNGVERTGNFPGILSPEPSSLSPIPTSFFSPITADPSSLSFFHDLSPNLHGIRSFIEGNPFLTSPSTFVSPTLPSIDLFNNFSQL